MSLALLAQNSNDPHFVASLNDLLQQMQRQINTNAVGQMQAVTTANRPNPPIPFVNIVDTSIGKVIYHNGTNWVDSAGAIV